MLGPVDATESALPQPLQDLILLQYRVVVKSCPLVLLHVYDITILGKNQRVPCELGTLAVEEAGRGRVFYSVILRQDLPQPLHAVQGLRYLHNHALLARPAVPLERQLSGSAHALAFFLAIIFLETAHL